jgi:hypothetical protein
MKNVILLIMSIAVIFIGFPLVVAYAEEPPEIKKIDKHIKNRPQQAQIMHPDELLGDLKESKKEIKPKKRVIPEVERQQKDVQKFPGRAESIHRDFVIYNFERMDDELADLRGEALYTAEELSEIREREKIYIEALEELLIKSKRYDHFFAKWDNLKETLKSGWAVGGGSLMTTLIGGIGIWWQRRRRRKKENSNG